MSYVLSGLCREDNSRQQTMLYTVTNVDVSCHRIVADGDDVVEWIRGDGVLVVKYVKYREVGRR